MNPELELMAQQCELLGHSDEYWIDAHGLCVYCKQINPRFEEL